MNKTELIAAVAEKSELSKKDAEKAVAAVLDTIVDRVAKAEKVQIVGFGTFEQRTRNERTGCDPRTKTQIIIPASRFRHSRLVRLSKRLLTNKLCLCVFKRGRLGLCMRRPFFIIE